ncbi:MAG: SusD/RagB family nutrient-binding outer membrane lipoprotein, partial [Sphingobacterium thalpophilum]
MKKLRKESKSNLYILVLSCIILISSCTKDYPAINTDKNSIAEVSDANLPFLFTAALQSVQIGDQTAQNLFADQYAQYIANNATYFPTDRYFIQMSWAKDNFTPIYTRVVPQLQTIFENKESSSAEYALADIWWVFAFHRVTDYWGPIPYSQAGISKGTVPYDSQEKIYEDFFKRLKTAVEVLKKQTNSKPYGSFDVIYGGDVNKWIKFANTLRLRLALRVSKVNPSLAKTEAEAAFASGVFMTSPDDDALLEKNLVDFNKISQMSEWFEFNMSATME